MNVGTQLTKTGALAHLATLDDVVADYIARFQNKFEGDHANHSKGHDDPVVDFCKEAVSLAIAIQRAVDGRRRDGKMFSKGSCVRTSSKAEMTKKLLDRQAELRRAKTFEHLYDTVERAGTWGIGRMTLYAVTERIGAYLGIKPADFLYLHAGPLQGWKRLTGKAPSSHRIARTELPPALCMIELYHVENLLCEFRELLHPGMLK